MAADNNQTEEMQAAEVVLAAIAPFVVGIITRDSLGREGRMLGTGTLVRFNNRKLVLTARHVLPYPQPDDVFFLPCPSGGLQVSSSLQQARYEWRQRWNIRAVASDRDLDLAAIFLADEPQNAAYFDVDTTTAAISDPSAPIALLGYPVAKGKPILIGDLLGYVALPDFQCATSVDPGTIPGIRSFQFAIDYPSAAIAPTGYSGAMAWYNRAGLVSLADLRRGFSPMICGLVTDYFPSSHALVGTKADHIITFLEQVVNQAAARLPNVE